MKKDGPKPLQLNVHRQQLCLLLAVVVAVVGALCGTILLLLLQVRYRQSVEVMPLRTLERTPDDWTVATLHALRKPASGEWQYVPFRSQDDVKDYLLNHHMMADYIRGATLAFFEAVPIHRNGESTYSRAVCLAGGSVLFDYFAGPSAVQLMVTPDMRQLSRTIVYRSDVGSTPEEAVMELCGVSMAVESSARLLPLPFSAKFSVTLQIAEQWQSTSSMRPESIPQGSKVSLEPLSQWQLRRLTVTATLAASKRDFTPWEVALSDVDAEADALGVARQWQMLALKGLGAHSVSGEVTVTQTVSCDTTSVAHSRVCTNGAELLKNQHGEPSLTTSVTLR